MKRLLVFCCLALVVSGCRSVESQRSEALELRTPQRVAVLPFEDVAEGDQGLAIPLGALIDAVPFLSDDTQDKKRACEILRSQVQANLHWTSLELLSPQVVDQALEAISQPPSPLDPARPPSEAQREARAREVGEELGADLVFFGRITEWDRHYVVVASWVTISVELELRDGRSGRLLFRSELSDVETAGLHKGMIATEPLEILVVGIGETLRGLRNTLFASLSNELSRVAIQELKGAPEGSPPAISHLAATLWGRELRVVALGTPGAKALLKLPAEPPLLMSETAPGVYQLRLVDLPAGLGGQPEVEVELVSAQRKVVARRRPTKARPRRPSGAK